jgi:competence protein ComEC
MDGRTPLDSLARPGAAGASTAAGAALLAAGAAGLGFACPPPPPASLLVALSAFLAAVGAALARGPAAGAAPRRGRAATSCAFAGLVLAFAAAGSVAADATAARLLAAAEARRGWVVARVRGLPAAGGAAQRLRLEVVRSSLGLARGARLDARVEDGALLPDGVLVRALATVEGFAPRRNPGGFDARAWARTEGLSARARLVPSTVRVLAGPAPGDLGARLVSPLRARLLEAIRAQERGRAGAFLAGFLLGDRSALDPAAGDDLRRIGGLHLLAISGMHVVLVAAVLERALRLAGARGRRAALLRLAAVSLYCALAGGAPSVWRAGVSAAWIEAGLLLGRRVRGAQALALAVLVLLALRPAHALDAGFQLSVLATWGLLALAAPAGAWLRARSPRLGPVVHEGFLTTLAAQLVALPCLAVRFGTISALGLVANLLLVPVTNVALVAGLIGLVLALPAAGLARPFWCVADAAALLTLRLAAGLARTPAALVPLAPSALACAMLAAALAALTVPGLVPEAARRGRARAVLAGLALLAAAALVLPVAAPRPAGGTLVVTALDVGQGDALLVALPDRRALLVDAGDAGPGGDHGARTVLPALRVRGVGRLHAVVASHGDRDHAGGIPAVLRDVACDVVAGPFDVADSLLARARARGGAAGAPRRRALVAGDVLLAGEDYEVRALWPPPGFRADPGWTTNRESVVLLLTRRGPAGDTARVLLTGDIDTLVERRLVEAGLPRCDVLKVAHHGSRTSSADAFLAGTAPRIALASLGRGNRFGHPHADVQARFAARAVAWRATDREGALDVVVAPGRGGRLHAFVAPARGARPLGLAKDAERGVPCGSHDVAPHASIGGPGFGSRHELPRPRRCRRARRARGHDRGPRQRPRRRRRGGPGPRARDRGRAARSRAGAEPARARGGGGVDRSPARARRRHPPPGRVHAHPPRVDPRRVSRPRAQHPSFAPARLPGTRRDRPRLRPRGAGDRLHRPPGHPRHRRRPDPRPVRGRGARRRHSGDAGRAHPCCRAPALSRGRAPLPRHPVRAGRAPHRLVGAESGMSLEHVVAVLFDLGGTCLEIDHPRMGEALAARGTVPAPGWASRAERAGRERLEALLAAGSGNDEHWRAFLIAMLESAGAGPADAAAIFDELRAFHRRHHLWNRVMPGIPEALRALAGRGYRLAAVSNSDGRAESILSQLGLAHEFEFVVDSHEVGVEKPDPRIFLLACERLRLHPSRVAYVGDVHGIDVVGARGAGLRPVLLDVYGAYDGAEAPRVAEPAQLLGLFPDRRRDGLRRAAGER